MDLTASGSYEVGGNAVTQITEANDGDTLEAEVTVTFPIGGSVDNTSQDQTATLSAFTVTATQVHPELGGRFFERWGSRHAAPPPRPPDDEMTMH